MPNPFVGNQHAAAYVDFYASRDMENAAVDRLYQQGMRHHQLTLKHATAAWKPAQPSVVRSAAEIEAYATKLCDEELKNRRSSLNELEQQMYPLHQRQLTHDAMQQHIQHMYADQMTIKQRRAQRRGAMQKPPPVANDVVKSDSPWKLALRSPPRDDWKPYFSPNPSRKRSIVEQTDYFKKLARPLRVWPKVEASDMGFSVYTRYKK